MKKIILIFLFVFLVSGCDSLDERKQTNIENKFEKIAVKYYKENLEGKVIGVDKYTITLTSLSRAGYDISEIVNSKTKESCDETSNVVITLKDNKNYDVEVNLICDKESSK